ncbi:hypothetical protein GCM10010429_12220 [Micromonospora olivasterospora]|uniref:Uncharacterized protein n=1 Tax=Micromonospora olivasterospora TaxID=1880 RepID=A0A562I7G4_MICOL|nr:hypothetical protein [Micromonospora olivasterospora]TWH66665.1 hypothetical protein JD77_01623 [Micromonospora olivasterospora]
MTSPFGSGVAAPVSENAEMASSDDTVGSPVRRVSYDEYVLAVALTLARRHRPVWCWRRWRRVCRCGADLPCRARHRIPINRGHWPDGEAR